MPTEPASAARPRGRPRKDEEPASVDVLLAAALRAFAVYGYEGASLRSLAGELGVSHNALRQRFGSKAALWTAAVDWGFGGLAEEVTRHDDPAREPVERLRSLIEAFVIANGARPDLLRLVNAEGSERTERLDYLYRTYLSRLEDVTRPAVERLLGTGRITAVRWRSLFFLITAGGTALFSNEALAMLIDRSNPTRRQAIRDHARFVADIIVTGLTMVDQPQ